MIHTVGGSPSPVFCGLGMHGANLKSLMAQDYRREALEIFKFFMSSLPSGTNKELKTLMRYAESSRDGELISLLKDPEDLAKVKGWLKS